MNSPLPDPAPVLDLLVGFRLSKTMFAAVSLGVFEALAEGPQSLESLATRLSASLDGLERLLDACVGLQLLTKSSDGLYHNAPVATTYLCTQSPHRLTGYIQYSNKAMWKLWSHLEDAVREGTSRWKQAYDFDGPIFAHFFRDEEAKREFLMGMHGFGMISSPCVAACFDLSRFHTFCDLGGATGHLAIAACTRYSHLQGIVFDLPEAVPLAREIVSASTFADRFQILSGDFFHDPLPDADLFALGRILHDWTEAKILLLLQRIFDRLPSQGGVLIAEKLLSEDKSGPRWAQMQNLNMLTCTEGKERTVAEYTKLLQQIGFQDIQARSTDAPLDAVLAIKP